MTLHELYIMVRDNLGMGAVGLTVLFSIIEFSKIKINPWLNDPPKMVHRSTQVLASV